MGQLRVGDRVFGSDGWPTRINYVSPVMTDKICYKITFSDGTHIVADADHKWQVTKTGKQCPFCNPPTVRTTQEMLDLGLTKSGGLYKGKRMSKHHWHMQLPGALKYEPQPALPMDPYLLGLWLGDGTTSNSQFTTADPELAEAWTMGGWTITKQPSSPYGYGIKGLAAKLTDLNLLNNKHVPMVYVYANTDDRRALLAGLLDTDGTGKKGVATFDNTNEQIARAVLEIARSLGYRVKLKNRIGKLNGVAHKRCWRVYIRAHEQVFRLKRKADQFVLNTERYHAITAIEPIKSVPVQCIGVDAADHLFLAGENCVPTHNTGKSFAAIGMSIAVSNALPNWLGFDVVKSGTVMYLQVDTPRSAWKERLNVIVKAGHTIDKVYFADTLIAPYPFNILNPEHQKWLKNKVDIVNPVMVVIDTLRESFAGDENDSSIMKAVVSELVAACMPSAVVLISHSRKEHQYQGQTAEGDLMTDARGSSYIAGRMDCVAKLTDKHLYYKGRSAGQGQLKIMQHPTTGLIIRDMKETFIEEKVQQIIDKHYDFKNMNQVVKHLAEMEENAKFNVSESTWARKVTDSLDAAGYFKSWPPQKKEAEVV